MNFSRLAARSILSFDFFSYLSMHADQFFYLVGKLMVFLYKRFCVSVEFLHIILMIFDNRHYSLLFFLNLSPISSSLFLMLLVRLVFLFQFLGVLLVQVSNNLNNEITVIKIVLYLYLRSQGCLLKV
jgi:hypothetical protein